MGIGPNTKPLQSSFVNTYVPQPFEAFGKAAQSIENRHQQAIQTEDAISTALDSIPNIPGSTYHKQKKNEIANNVRNKLEDISEKGMKFQTTGDLRSLARQLASDPELQRIQNQTQQYKQYSEQLEDSDLTRSEINEFKQAAIQNLNKKEKFEPLRFNDVDLGETVQQIHEDNNVFSTSDKKTKLKVTDRQGNQRIDTRTDIILDSPPNSKVEDEKTGAVRIFNEQAVENTVQNLLQNKNVVERTRGNIEKDIALGREQVPTDMSKREFINRRIQERVEDFVIAKHDAKNRQHYGLVDGRPVPLQSSVDNTRIIDNEYEEEEQNAAIDLSNLNDLSIEANTKQKVDAAEQFKQTSINYHDALSELKQFKKNHSRAFDNNGNFIQGRQNPQTAKAYRNLKLKVDQYQSNYEMLQSTSKRILSDANIESQYQPPTEEGEEGRNIYKPIDVKEFIKTHGIGSREDDDSLPFGIGEDIFNTTKNDLINDGYKTKEIEVFGDKIKTYTKSTKDSSKFGVKPGAASGVTPDTKERVYVGIPDKQAKGGERIYKVGNISSIFSEEKSVKEFVKNAIQQKTDNHAKDVLRAKMTNLEDRLSKVRGIALDENTRKAVEDKNLLSGETKPKDINMSFASDIAEPQTIIDAIHKGNFELRSVVPSFEQNTEEGLAQNSGFLVNVTAEQGGNTKEIKNVFINKDISSLFNSEDLRHVAFNRQAMTPFQRYNVKDQNIQQSTTIPKSTLRNLGLHKTPGGKKISKLRVKESPQGMKFLFNYKNSNDTFEYTFPRDESFYVHYIKALEQIGQTEQIE